ncbi:MAG TPA: NAD(P)/FAD-dependent oxidoreductase [Vicinamibacteria bacterium]|nr:NAD(P)/FAD-dependent oxidoreductase [Vicinamibacteria bacterium]
MAERTYDCVIVGGRCAGAALAAYLARDGGSVMLLDADRRGTDRVLSTHTIHPPGMDVLDELGVGDDVRKTSPPARRLRLQIDDAHVDVVPPTGRDECCPRRHRLDGLLQDAAVAAGAELNDQTRVTELIREGGRVLGVRAERSGKQEEFRGRLTVGADGRHSTIAKLAGAKEYLGYDWPRLGYWAYWEPPPAWNGDEYPYDFLLRFVGSHRRLIFTTDEGEILLGTMPRADDRERWRTDHEKMYEEDLRSDPVFEPLVADGTIASKVVGTLKERFFFRQSAGPGWALVGDAGHHKDPLIGWGISEALVQAKHLAAAVRLGTDSALERYWRQRDVDALPRFRYGEDRGKPGSMNPVVPVVLRRVPEVPGLSEHMFRETEYDVNPYELLPVGKVGRWTMAAALRGRPGLILDFLRQGRRVSSVQREVMQYRKLLDAVDSNDPRKQGGKAPSISSV